MRRIPDEEADRCVSLFNADSVASLFHHVVVSSPFIFYSLLSSFSSAMCRMTVAWFLLFELCIKMMSEGV